MAIVKTDLKQVPKEWKEFLSLSGKPKWILEVGTFRGKGTTGLCRIAKNVITIDIDDRRIDRPKNSIFIKANSQKPHTFDLVKSKLSNNKLDVLFIDADHSYEGVKRDFELYKPLVKDGGIIGLHDIVDSAYHRRKDCYVFKFWNEIKEAYKYKEIIYDGNWAGIGVIWNI